jgi:dCTP deaminase
VILEVELYNGHIMSILSDREIKHLLQIGRLQISGLREGQIHPQSVDGEQIQPASVDLTLGDGFIALEGSNTIHLHGEGIHAPMNRYDMASRYWLEPGQFVLGTTKEKVVIPDDLVARVEGKSSLGRLGLCVHATAGFIDPGFRGSITLEFFNMSKSTLVLYSGRLICQLAFEKLSSPALRPYGHPELNSKYQDQSGVVGSRVGQKFENVEITSISSGSAAWPSTLLGGRVFHRRADLFGKLEKMEGGLGYVRYEWPHNGKELVEVSMDELTLAVP